MQGPSGLFLAPQRGSSRLFEAFLGSFKLPMPVRCPLICISCDVHPYAYHMHIIGLAQTVYVHSKFVLFCAKISKYTGYIFFVLFVTATDLSKDLTDKLRTEGSSRQASKGGK